MDGKRTLDDAALQLSPKRVKLDEPEEEGSESEMVQGTANTVPSSDPATLARRLTTARRYLAAQAHAVVIPSYSTWFSLGAVHPIERRSLPEFFNSRNRSKVPAIYKDYRDFIVHTYRLNPSEYLTVTACRRNLAGDVCAIMRVHAFLEQWGLINYQVRLPPAPGRAHTAQIDAESKPAALVPPFTGHFRILVDTPRGLAPLHSGTPQPLPGAPTTELRREVLQTDSARPARPDSKLSASVATNLASSALATSDAAVRETPPCGTCGASATSTRYSSVKTRGDFAVCTNCYNEGRFPSTMHSGDFIKLEEGPYHQADETSKWEDQEVLLLLEGLEMYDEDWDKISEHVGTRSKDQCILHFLQMPIEDPFLEPVGTDLGPLQYSRLPFNEADNPVLSVMAFLAASVDKSVAAKAAGEAVEEMDTALRTRAEQAKTGEAPISNGTVVGEEAMEVDTEESKTVPRNNVEKAAMIALGSAAAKAHVLALEEDATLHSLVTSVVEAQVKKLELKLSHFAQLESLLEVERRALEQSKQQLYEDRLKMSRMINEVQELYARAKEGQAGGITPQEMAAIAAHSGSAPPRASTVSQPGQAPNGGQGFVSMM